MDLLSTDHCAYFHVTMRSRNREQIFHWDEDRWIYLNLLHDESLRRGVSIHVWTLMSNHVHLLVGIRQLSDLAGFMRQVNGRFAYRYNAARQLSGAVWQAKPRKELIVFDSYFTNCQLYIEYNPVRADLVAVPEDHHWSSARYHLLGIKDGLSTANPWYLSLGSTIPERTNAYRRLMLQYHTEQLKRPGGRM